jgi:hypothetical protein
MLLLQAFLLLLLSISSMAIPAPPGTATGPELEPLPDKQIFEFYGNLWDPHDTKAKMQQMQDHRGLWTRTAISEYSSFNLTSY